MNSDPGATTDSALRHLHLAIDPPAVYAALRAVARDLVGTEILGIYLLDDSIGFVRDDDFGPSRVPERFDPMTMPLPPDLTTVEFGYRTHPLGAVVIAAGAPVVEAEARGALEEHLAPALFRAAWLADSLDTGNRLREQLQFLQEMGGLIGRIELKPLLINVLDLVTGFLNTPIGSIILRDDRGTLRTVIDWGLPLDALARLETEGQGPLDLAMEEREPHLFRARDLRCREGGRVPDRLLVMPLLSNSESIGALALVAERANDRLSDEMLEVVGPAVSLAATAIENARLIALKLQREKEQQQLSVARRIQAGLLPSAPPPVKGIQLAASSVSANMIGGDYFDYFMFPDGALGLVVADVAGKGIPAGLIMTAARATFRGAAMERSDPAAILDRVNKSLADEDFRGRFVTGILARIDLDSWDVTVACAGHEPMMIRRSNGTIERVGTPALPLGVLAEAEYRNVHVGLAPDDVFVMFTDGVTEAMNIDRTQFGPDRLARVLDAVHHDATALRNRILDSVGAWVGSGPRHDDTTLIAARIEGS